MKQIYLPACHTPLDNQRFLFSRDGPYRDQELYTVGAASLAPLIIWGNLMDLAIFGNHVDNNLIIKNELKITVIYSSQVRPPFNPKIFIGLDQNNVKRYPAKFVLYDIVKVTNIVVSKAPP